MHYGKLSHSPHSERCNGRPQTLKIRIDLAHAYVKFFSVFFGERALQQEHQDLASYLEAGRLKGILELPLPSVRLREDEGR
jgi:hypothetical protein